MQYLKSNNVNLDKSFDNESDLNTLHKIKYLLTNLPKCDELLKYKDLDSKIYEAKLEKDCPKYFDKLRKHLNNKKNNKKNYKELQN